VAGCKKIEGVVEVSVTPSDNLLTLRFDPHVITRERLTAAVQKVVDSVEQ
jgi:hypothetical protein